jgi:5-methylcytosine-specific restriction enzyme subunit McrC
MQTVSTHQFTVFEHESLRVGTAGFTEAHRRLLEDYYGEGCPYFNLIHRGVKFREYVGILQLGDLSIEVLPKADQDASGTPHLWQAFLITMLQAAGLFPETTDTASLQLRRASLLDIYIQLFLKEVRALLLGGLARHYRLETGNAPALKGRLQFAQHLQHNLIHTERFYVRHQVYDPDHLHNTLLRQTLKYLSRMALAPALRTEIQSLLARFPEGGEVSVTEAVFEMLTYSRKTERYRTAHSIARLLLLSYHPDVRRGSNDVLALMFDANLLWEKYLLKMVRRELQTQYPGRYLLREQVRTDFWQPAAGAMRSVKPDLVLYEAEHPGTAVLVLDAKWKRVPDNRPADEDLKQMLIYNLYQGCQQSALVYPSGQPRRGISGSYQSVHGTSCSLQFVALRKGVNGIVADLEPLLQLVRA